MENYTVNLLLEWTIEEIRSVERVLWIGNDSLFVMDVYKNNSPYLRNILEVQESSANGCVKILSDDDPYIIVASEEDIPEKYKDIRDRAWSMIKEIVYKEPDIFQTTFRRNAIRNIANQYNVSELTVFNYLKRYWIRGKTPNALLPMFHNCGGPGKSKSSGTVKRGRPRRHPEISGDGVNVTEDIKKIFRISMNRFYYKTAKNSLVTTYELMRKEYFAEDYRIENGTRIPIVKPQSDIPSLRQFRYFYEQNYNVKKEISSRYSNKKFQKQYRAITGTAMAGVLQPGTYEIDCQIADVYLVSRFNRNWVIGRPALYVCIDKFSRLITGVYVGLESGSFLGAAMSLVNSASNKSEFCKEYGIDIKEEDWPVHHLPQCIIADRGELRGKDIENLISNLGVTIQNTPPYRADWKSSVERFFGLTNDRTKPFMPGVVDLEGRERGDKDYRMKAKLTLHEFTKIIIKCILFHNNNYLLNDYKREQGMVEDNVQSIPIELWNWGIANRGGTLRSTPVDTVKFALMPTVEATVTAKGIKFKDMYYASQELLKSQIFMKARAKGTWKVKISYDPRNLNYIYVHGDDFNEYEKCFLLDENSRYKDKAIEEIEYLIESEKMQKSKNLDEVAQAKTELIAEIEQVVKQAEKEYKMWSGEIESDRQRVENIRVNRTIEKTANRVQEMFELEKESLDNQVKPILLERDDSKEENDTLGLLLQKQKEGLKNAYGKNNYC